jgi:RNA polymerase sigma-70 factor (TIGR02943 family)
MNYDVHTVRIQVDSTPIPARPQESAPEAACLSDPERWVELYGDFLFRFAMIRVRDLSKAEDAVQETFLAALKGGKNFAGRSEEKGWLVGILKNKISDYYRKTSRETSFTDTEFYARQESNHFVAAGLFKGRWIQELAPEEWTSPGASLDKDVFWQTFRECSSKLPKNVAAAFSLREIEGMECKEICSTLNISESNLWVMLHRARMALRHCMEVNWFGKKELPE